jgi:hypothetical protein
MSASTSRRPLPALGFLLALTVLTSVVWWRVLHRPDASGTTAAPVPTVHASCSAGGRAVAFPAPATVNVQVLNAAQRDGLAASVRDQLKARGFTVSGIGTAPSPLGGIAEVRYGPTGKNGATLLSFYFPGAKMVPAGRSDAGVDLVLGKAFTAVAAPATVNKAVATARKPC